MRKHTLVMLFAILMAVPLAYDATEAVKLTVLQKIEFPDSYATVMVKVDVSEKGLIARHTHLGIEVTTYCRARGICS